MAGHPGDYRVICDVSGFKCWASETAMTWDKRRVLRRFLGSESQRHPQELVRAIRDDQSVSNPRPEATGSSGTGAASLPLLLNSSGATTTDGNTYLAYNQVTPSSL